MNSATAAPAQKVTASIIAGAVMVVVLALLDKFAHITLDPTVSAAITTIIASATAYLVPPAAADVPVVSKPSTTP